MLKPLVACPLCAHGEKLSKNAANALADAIAEYCANAMGNPDALPELENIRNHILNMRERAMPIDPLLL